jgi:hypothetical protein
MKTKKKIQKKNQVIVEIISGCAEVSRIPEGFEVKIIDKDAQQTDVYTKEDGIIVLTKRS